MKKYFYTISCCLIFSVFFFNANGQGCVAVKNMSTCSMGWDEQSKGLQLSLNYRYFRSYKHFRGKHEEKHRVEEGTEVINNDNSVLLGVSYTANSKWSFSATIPYMNIDRSSMYEHYGNSHPLRRRFHTQSSGLGDVRLTAYYNVLQHHRFHLTGGLGVKLPTGNYAVKDYFHKLDDQDQEYLEYKVVDQSIQLGDGGLGVLLEFNANYTFDETFSAYAAGQYLFNPRNTNGVERSPNLTANIPLSNEFSVADQLFFRAGAQAAAANWQFGAGGRIEGIPSEDLIGKSDGWRRPGYIISAEPSVYYNAGAHSIGVNFPIALVRNRTQNTIDKRRTEMTGEYQIGDAAFADWLLSISYAYRF